MADAAASAVRFATGRSRLDLDRDEMLLFALVRAVEIVGEAAARLSPEARAAMPNIPWSLIVGMRNRLVHAYFDVDRDILWTTVTEALPALLPALAAAVREEQGFE
jgi:uncharacterized protein with HEPN domain